VDGFNRPYSTPEPPDQPDPDKPEPGPHDLREAVERIICMLDSNAYDLHPDPAEPLLSSTPPAVDEVTAQTARVLRMVADWLLGALAGSFPPGEYEPPWELCLAVPGTCPNGTAPHPFISPSDLHATACVIQPWEGWRP
jgi:hypothetical protein